MCWTITLHKEAGDPVHIDVDGDITLGKGWEDKVKWLANVIRVIGEYDEQSKK